MTEQIGQMSQEETGERLEAIGDGLWAMGYGQEGKGRKESIREKTGRGQGENGSAGPVGRDPQGGESQSASASRLLNMSRLVLRTRSLSHYVVCIIMDGGILFSKMNGNLAALKKTVPWN